MGGPNQQYSLRWNNYSSHVTSALDDLRTEDELTDVTLCAEGNKVRAHKVLLSACSTFFRETFRENPCQHPVIILKGVTYADLQAVVAFIYNGQVNVTQERLNCFLQTAEMLQIKGLTDMSDKAAKEEGGGSITTTSKMIHKRPAAAGVHNHVNPAARLSTDASQRPPTPKRRKFLPMVAATSASATPTPTSGLVESNSNSPGPSTRVKSEDGNSMGGAESATVAEGDENSMNETGLLNYEGEESYGGDEEGYQNNYVGEDGAEYVQQQDLSIVDQGAISSRRGSGGADEAEVMVVEGGYDIVAYEDAEEMPLLTPAVANTASAQVFRPRLESHIKPRPTLTSAPTHSQFVNILRKRKSEPVVSEPLEPALNPLDASAKNKNQSPYIGEPFMDPESGETMFPCLMCDKKYKLKSSLESHVKVHEGSENTCSICGQTMSRQRDLKRHVATVHKGLLMPDGTITYPPDIDEIYPPRIRKGRMRSDRPDDQDSYFAPLLLPSSEFGSLN